MHNEGLFSVAHEVAGVLSIAGSLLAKNPRVLPVGLDPKGENKRPTNIINFGVQRAESF